MPENHSATDVRLAWAICTIARSGSTWLSQLVASTGIMGKPEEYLLHWPNWRTRFGLPAVMPREEYLAAIARHCATANGVFAIKGSIDEMQPFFELYPSAPCVWLSRENKLEQAVSWARAQESGVWHRRDGERGRAIQEPPLDLVLAFYDEILRRQAAWSACFVKRAIQPLSVTYEEVCRQPLASVRLIADHIGVDSSAIKNVASPLRIVRDENTARLVRRAAEALAERETKR